MNKLMGRGLSVILAVVIAVGCMVCSSAASGKYGDLDNDGKINSSDALAVLKHSVGSTLLTGDSLVYGDVNADSTINSADALLVLQYAVGKISSFPAEKTSAPATKADILKCYTQTISKARTDIPAYRLRLTTETTDVKLSGDLLEMMPKSEVEKMKNDMLQKQSYTNLFKQGNASALANLPAECSVTDPAAFKDITLKVLEDGNYQIDIKFKDEKNPTKDSVIVKLLGLPDKQTVTKQMEDEFKKTLEGLEDVPMSVKVPSLEYKNCSVTCVVNPQTGEIVSHKIVSEMSNSVVVECVLEFPIVGPVVLDMTTDTTTRTTFEYSNFVY